MHWAVRQLAVTLLALVAIGGGARTAAAEPTRVTFSRDVAPIFQAKCVSCHQPGSIAPMSLRTYADARPWARAIRQRVAARQMPPWHISRAVGVQKFKNDLSLTDEQIHTIVTWVDQGSREGRPSDLPALKPIDERLTWQAERDGFGPPDLVVVAPDFTVPAVSQDLWHRPVSTIAGISEPRWVRMVEIRPSSLAARKVLHHAIASLAYDPGDTDNGQFNYEVTSVRSDRPGADDPSGLSNIRPSLMEWAVGKGYDRYADGTGKLVKPGQRIAWDEHFHAAGETVTAGAELGLWFYPADQPPARTTFLVGFTALKDGAIGLDIPPNSIAHSEGFTVLRENTVFTNFQPHFHLRGRAMMVEAIMPDGRVEAVSYVDNFNFNWMTNYIYAEDAAPAYPRGTVIHVTAFYDNTAGNRQNPDPSQWVGYGDRTVDEMAHAWMNVYYLSDEEYAAWLQRHDGKPGVPLTHQ